MSRWWTHLSRHELLIDGSAFVFLVELLHKFSIRASDGPQKLLKVIISDFQIPAPWGLRGCRNRPASFPGRMSQKATKPGYVYLPHGIGFWFCCCLLGPLCVYCYGRTLSERPCYILPLFFFIFFYGRLSWPNGWTDLHEIFTRGRYWAPFANLLDQFIPGPP